jgi:hypothetical protein
MPDTEKKIFRYFDGRGDAHADPLAVYRSFMECFDGDPDPVLKAARGGRRPEGEPEPPAEKLSRLRAEAELARAAQVCLEMVPFDRATGEGATEEDCLRALYSWLEWLEGNAGPAASAPT